MTTHQATRYVRWTPRPRSLAGWRTITILHCAPGGGPVLKGHATWRTISGISINTHRGYLTAMFRRGQMS